MPTEIFTKLERLAESSPTEFDFTVGLWCQTLYELLITYYLASKFAREDALSAVIPLYHGRVAGFTRAMQTLEADLASLEPGLKGRLVSLEANRALDEQTQGFIRRRPALLAQWRREKRRQSPCCRWITYREFHSRSAPGSASGVQVANQGGGQNGRYAKGYQ